MSRARVRYRLGIDLGGTKTEGIVLDAVTGKELFRRRIPTEAKKGYRQVLSNIKDIHDSLLSHIKKGSSTLGVGTPGAVSPRTGLLKNANTRCLNKRPIGPDLKRLLRRDLVLANDANCFALAEAVRGAGRGKRTVFGVIMGTGCGGGLVIDKKIHGGLQRIAGEWGHSSIDPRGPLCYCGSRGCIETFISGGGLEDRYEKTHGKRRTVAEIAARSRKGSRPDAAFMREFLSRFGRALANLINIIDPDIIVIGGGVSNLPELYRKGAAEVRRHVFSDHPETPIVRHSLGDSAGVIGAALLGGADVVF